MLTFESYSNKEKFKSNKPSRIFRDKLHSMLWRLARTDREWFLSRTELSMPKLLDEHLNPISRWVDGNDIPEYQTPLRLLYRARKANVEQRNGKFYCPHLNKKMIYVDNEWSWLNKLSTNVYAHVNLLSDYFEFLYDYEDDFRKIAYPLLEFGIKDFKETIKKYVHLDRVVYGLDFSIFLGVHYPEPAELVKFVRVIQHNTEKGDIHEQKAINYIEARGWKISHQGSNGDLIDILLGIDLIIEKQGTIKTVQVKSYSVKHIDTQRYVNIDVFIGFSDTGEVEYIESR